MAVKDSCPDGDGAPSWPGCSRQAPWYVVPADHKWFTRLAVAAALVDALERLGPEYPARTGRRCAR